MSKPVSRQSSNGVPAPVVPIAELMSSFPAPWALCGGWAVDAWLGRPTREHEDGDRAVFNQDRRVLQDHLAGWQLVAHDERLRETSELWDGRALELPGHLHGRLNKGDGVPEGILKAEDGFGLDVQLNDRTGGEWVLSNEPHIALPLERAVAQSRWGLPAAAPEVLLFFKALDLRRRDKLDFAVLLPVLSREQRDWLRSAIASVGHPWLSQLSP